MTDAELSLKIAEHLGWKLSAHDEYWISPKGWRGCSFTEKYSGLPNMVTDPAMTVMLMGKLFSENYTLEIKPLVGGPVSLQIKSSNPYPRDFEWVIGLLGRAVAEAFAKVKGLI